MILIALVVVWLWCRWLASKAEAPGYVRWLPKALFVCWLTAFLWTVISLAVVYVRIRSGGVDPEMKSELLADGIAGAMHRAVLGLLPFLLAAPALVWTSWRLRGAPQRA
jgi:hypothetical protein